MPTFVETLNPKPGIFWNEYRDRKGIRFLSPQTPKTETTEGFRVSGILHTCQASRKHRYRIGSKIGSIESNPHRSSVPPPSSQAPSLQHSSKLQAPPSRASQPPTVNSIKLETGLRPNSAGIPYTLLLRIEAMGFPTFGLLL